MVEKVSMRQICRNVGVDHAELTEVLRRVASHVKDDKEVITHQVGTFYLKKTKATTRTLEGVVYDVPAKEQVALRGPRFPGRESDVMADLFIRKRSSPGTVAAQTTVDFACGDSLEFELSGSATFVVAENIEFDFVCNGFGILSQDNDCGTLPRIGLYSVDMDCSITRVTNDDPFVGEVIYTQGSENQTRVMQVGDSWRVVGVSDDYGILGNDIRMLRVNGVPNFHNSLTVQFESGLLQDYVETIN